MIFKIKRKTVSILWSHVGCLLKGSLDHVCPYIVLHVGDIVIGLCERDDGYMCALTQDNELVPLYVRNDVKSFLTKLF